MIYRSSIIVVNYNNFKNLILCLESIFQQKNKYDEVILVDNGSNDMDINELQLSYNDLKIYVNSTDKSPYISRNIGLRKANSENIVLIDSNCTPQNLWLNSGLNLLKSQGGIVSGPIKADLSNNSSVYNIADALSISKQFDSYQDGNSYPGGHLFFRKQIVRDIGYFKEVRSGGDIDWTLRATQFGYKLGFNYDTAVVYRTKNKLKYINKAKRIGKGYIESNLTNNILFNAIITARPPNPFVIHSRLYEENVKIGFFRFFKLYIVVYKFRLHRNISMLKAYFNKMT